MRYKSLNIILLSLLVEGFLASFYLIHLYANDVPLSEVWSSPTWNHLALGLLASVPLFAANFLLFGPLAERVRWLNSCHEFKDRIVRPLAAELDYRSGLVVACSAGIGEELFFRGLLQHSFGLVAASIAFALMHFGPAVVKYRLVATIYALIGAYFGLIYIWAGTLWVPVAAHATYDYFALIYMRYVYPAPDDPLAPPRESPIKFQGKAFGALRRFLTIKQL